jgi:hypothetical protein
MVRHIGSTNRAEQNRIRFGKTADAVDGHHSPSFTVVVASPWIFDPIQGEALIPGDYI